MMKSFRKAFLTGILFIVPVVVTIKVMEIVYNITVNTVATPAMNFITKHWDFSWPLPLVKIGVHVGSAVVFVLAVFFIGIFARNVIGKKIIGLGEWLINHVPVVHGVYNAVKQFVETFIADKGDAFKEVVMIEYPRKGVFMMGFVGSKSDVGGQVIYNVFIPTTPNPTSGWYAMFAANEVEVLDLTIDEGMKIIISGGVLYPTASKELVTEKIKLLRDRH